jgi:hypothetical protein
MKEDLNKVLRKNKQTEILERKIPFSQIKKYNGRPLQQTRKS